MRDHSMGVQHNFSYESSAPPRATWKRLIRKVFITPSRSFVLLLNPLASPGQPSSAHQQGVLAAVHALHGDVARAQQFRRAVSHL